MCDLGCGLRAEGGNRVNRLTLLTTKECHLCVRARVDLDAVARRTGVGWAEIDVADDAGLAREYGDRLPVVLLDGREHGYWDVDVERLERDLGVAQDTPKGAG